MGLLGKCGAAPALLTALQALGLLAQGTPHRDMQGARSTPPHHSLQLSRFCGAASQRKSSGVGGGSASPVGAPGDSAGAGGRHCMVWPFQRTAFHLCMRLPARAQERGT